MQKVKVIYGTTEIFFSDTAYDSAYVQADKFINRNKGKKPMRLYYKRLGKYIFENTGLWQFIGSY